MEYVCFLYRRHGCSSTPSRATRTQMGSCCPSRFQSTLSGTASRGSAGGVAGSRMVSGGSPGRRRRSASDSSHEDGDIGLVGGVFHSPFGRAGYDQFPERRRTRRPVLGLLGLPRGRHAGRCGPPPEPFTSAPRYRRLGFSSFLAPSSIYTGDGASGPVYPRCPRGHVNVPRPEP